MKVDTTLLSSVLNKIAIWSNDQIGRYICVSNVHMCMEVFDSEHYQKVVNSSDLTIPDGKPLVWAQRLLKCPDTEQIRGYDLTMSVCELAANNNLSIGLYKYSLFFFSSVSIFNSSRR